MSEHTKKLPQPEVLAQAAQRDELIPLKVPLKKSNPQPEVSQKEVIKHGDESLKASARFANPQTEMLSIDKKPVKVDSSKPESQPQESLPKNRPKEDSLKTFDPKPEVVSKDNAKENPSKPQALILPKFEANSKEDPPMVFQNREEVFKDLESCLVKIKTDQEVVKRMSSLTIQTTEATTQAALMKESSELRSMASEISLGFGDESPEARNKVQVVEGPEMASSILRTSVVFAIYCSHQRMPLMKNHGKGYLWLPHTFIEDDRREKITDQQFELFKEFQPNFLRKNKSGKSSSATESTSVAKKKILTEKRSNKFLETPQLHHEYSIQMPDGSFVNRYLFLAKWADKPKIECCRQTSTIEWFPIDKLIKPDKSTLEKLWGNEVQSLANEIQQRIVNPELPLEPYCYELIGQDVQRFLMAVNDNCNGSQLNSLQKKLPKDLISILNSCGMREKDILKIYCDYIQHCYPAETMSQRSFLNYCFKIGFNCWDEDQLKSLFRSMQFFSKDFLRFPEFLLGIAILGSKESQSAMRVQYIFRFYDGNCDGFLDREDFKNLLRDVKSMCGSHVIPAEVDKECSELLKNVFKLPEGPEVKVSVDELIKNFHLIPGASHVLFRAHQDIITLMHTNVGYQLVQHPSDCPFKPHLVGTCNRCKPKKYNLAYHYVQLNPLGRITENHSVMGVGDLDEKTHFESRETDAELKHSIEVLFSDNHVANRVIKIVRQLFNFIRLGDKQKPTAEKVTAELTIDLVTQLCREVTEIFALEPRVLKVNSPCFVMGDIHGNISDLLIFEKQLWPLAPTAQGPSVLFLGDYVDRGDFSIECVCYLFAMKLLMPNKFFLLRGNHEIRSIQKNFTFFRECVNKYQKNGTFIFETFNLVLDHLPIVGIVDESIYCAHGGIPQTTNRIEDLYSIPCPLTEPETGSRVAWEILWNDPVTDEELKEVCAFQNISPDCGFADNIRRSTAYYFGERATRAFLKANNLSHVIRAHELELGGYRIHHNGCLLTVFSSSRYCNTANRAASIYCEIRKSGGLLKIISLDT